VVKSTELFLRKQYETYKSAREETTNEIKMPVTISLSGGKYYLYYLNFILF
jgi:hypothetical protein